MTDPDYSAGRPDWLEVMDLIRRRFDVRRIHVQAAGYVGTLELPPNADYVPPKARRAQ